MNIFLGAELEGRASSKWFELQKDFSSRLLTIKDISYGENLVSITIISIIMSKNYYENGGYKERKYYNKKEREADIRLRVNYDNFVKSDMKESANIYIAHILESIRFAGDKAGPPFDTKRLLDDVEQILTKKTDNF